jgi:hypothetical protein
MKERKDLNIPELEALWAELLVGGKKILVGVFYRPPNAPVEQWNLIEESLDQAKQTGIQSIFILGDLNCDFQVPGNRLEGILSTRHFTQLIQEPTHISQQSSTLLDIIATTSLDLVINSTVRSPSLSNHCDVGVLLSLQKPKRQYLKRTVYDYKRANWRKLNQDIRGQDGKKYTKSVT